MKRTKIRPISAAKAATIPARRACVEAVVERDGGCIFWDRVLEGEAYVGGSFAAPLYCSPVLDAHEPGKRSHGADPTDPDQCICLCRAHHDFVHLHPALSEELGLLGRGGHVRVLGTSPMVSAAEQ